MRKKLLRKLVNAKFFQRWHRKYSENNTPSENNSPYIQPNILNQILWYEKARTVLKDNVFNLRLEDQYINFYLPEALNDAVQGEIFKTNMFFEQDLLLEVREFIKPGSFILDAGTNIGNHTVFFSKICKAQKIYCFEPLKTAFGILEKNLELNNISNVEKYNVALGEEITKAVISDSYSDNLGGTGFAYTEDGDFDVVPLDSIKIDKLDFCKVDVEGCQLEFLNGAKDTLSKFKPVIWIEMLDESYKVGRGYNAEREVILPQKVLDEYGYRLVGKMSNIDFLYEHKDNPISKRTGKVFTSCVPETV